MSIEIKINGTCNGCNFVASATGSNVEITNRKAVKAVKPLHELRIGPLVLALAPECETLFRLKARMIRDSEIQGAELLEVYFQGKEPWIFDRKLTKKQAAKFLA